MPMIHDLTRSILWADGKEPTLPSNKDEAAKIIRIPAADIAAAAKTAAAARAAFGTLARWARGIAILARDDDTRAEAEAAVRAVLAELSGTQHNSARTSVRRALNTALQDVGLRLKPHDKGAIETIPQEDEKPTGQKPADGQGDNSPLSSSDPLPTPETGGETATLESNAPDVNGTPTDGASLPYLREKVESALAVYAEAAGYDAAFALIDSLYQYLEEYKTQALWDAEAARMEKELQDMVAAKFGAKRV